MTGLRLGPVWRMKGCRVLVDVFRRAEDDAAEAATLAVDVLGGGIDHDVGAEFERPLQQRRREHVVDDHLRAGGVAEIAHRLEIDDAQAGIGRRFKQHDLGRLAQRLAPLAEVAAVDELGLDAPLRQDLLDDVVAGAEQGIGRHHPVARLHQACDRSEHCGHAAGGGARGFGAFQQRHALLEHRDRWVAEAAIDEAGLRIVERRLRLFRGLIDVAGGHVDRLGGLGMLRARQAAMHHLGGETPVRGNVVLVSSASSWLPLDPTEP